MLYKNSTFFLNFNTVFLKFYKNWLYISLINLVFILKKNDINIWYYLINYYSFSKFALSFFDKYNFNFLYIAKKTFPKYFISYLIFFWSKLTFKGKGVRVRKFKASKKFTFSFGRSHWTKLYLNIIFFFCFKIRRQNYILISSLYNQFLILKNIIKTIKLINHYTKRGLRWKKQSIRKRFGKISQLVSSLHF